MHNAYIVSHVAYLNKETHTQLSTYLGFEKKIHYAFLEALLGGDNVAPSGMDLNAIRCDLNMLVFKLNEGILFVLHHLKYVINNIMSIN